MASATEDLNGEHFTKEVLDEIMDAFVKSNKEPSEELLDALTELYGKSRNELRRYFAIAARLQGSTMLSDHLRDMD